MTEPRSDKGRSEVTGRPLVRMTALRKSFPGVQAVGNGNFDLRPGEIHALVGENGAGKSTLIKILTGVHRPDSGTIEIDGQPIEFHSPVEARHAGIAAIHQEFTLVPAMTVRANLFLGRERTHHGIIDNNFERTQCEPVLERLGLSLDSDTLVSELTVAQQQLVEIARALLSECRVLVMDEPTAALAPREVEALFDILKEITGRGIGVIFISHRLDEIFEIADRITVMRDGLTIDTRTSQNYTRRQLIEQMVGRSLEDEFPRHRPAPKDICFVVRNLAGPGLGPISFAVKRGEVLGLAGLMGAGRTELARLIFGADPAISGEVELDGRRLHISSPRDAIRSGICLLTEDRKRQGLILGASVEENFALPNLRSWSRFGWINKKQERSRFAGRVSALNIRVTGPEQPAEHLSGGNQQKLLVARWLETDSKVIIFDEPTRGIDVGAKYETYLLINELAAQGKVIIVISSELPEVLGISDRILVMREGEISGEITNPKTARHEDVMALAVS